MLCLQFHSCSLDLTGSFSSSSPGWHHYKGKIFIDSMSTLYVSTQMLSIPLFSLPSTADKKQLLSVLLSSS